MNTITFGEDALRSARHTVRLIGTHPGFVLTVVLSLGLGIGANTAIFSVVNGVLIQPLPYPHADALVGIYNRLTISGQVYAFLKEVAAAVHAVNTSVPLADVRTLEDVYIRSMAQTSFTVTLLSIAAAMALALAVVGVYGVRAYAVARRRHEVGIRLALGAQPGAVRALFVRQGLLLTSLGGILGLISSAVLSPWISPVLYDVTALDPLTYAVSGAALAGTAILASLVPARRAASVDPMETLRSE
jgi:ABC-type antimicrobial peptide transport system permease subunit